MDLGLPLRSVSPGVDADVLAVLLRTHAPLTGKKVSELAGRSYAQVHHVLQRLVADGLVNGTRHGNAVSFEFNRDHVAAEPLGLLIRLHDAVELRIAEAVEQWQQPARSVAVYGSFARQDGTADSDVDVLLVRPGETDFDDENWASQRHELAAAIERWTGNPAQVVDLSASELRDAAARQEPLAQSLRRDARVVAGEPLSTFLAISTGSR